MSTYEYECEKCGHRFEEVLTIHDHDRFKPQCPKCESRRVVQVLSSFYAKTESKT